MNYREVNNLYAQGNRGADRDGVVTAQPTASDDGTQGKPCVDVVVADVGGLWREGGRCSTFLIWGEATGWENVGPMGVDNRE